MKNKLKQSLFEMVCCDENQTHRPKLIREIKTAFNFSLKNGNANSLDKVSMFMMIT